MAILLKTMLVRVSSIQIMQVRVQNKGKSVWKSRYDGDVSGPLSPSLPVAPEHRRGHHRDNDLHQQLHCRHHQLFPLYAAM